MTELCPKCAHDLTVHESGDCDCSICGFTGRLENGVVKVEG